MTMITLATVDKGRSRKKEEEEVEEEKVFVASTSFLVSMTPYCLLTALLFQMLHSIHKLISSRCSPQ